MPSLSLSAEDLARDSLADLFECNRIGAFFKLSSYFHAIDWQNKSEADLLAATRRLVFSQVNQALYHIYRTAGPSLNKVLRNLKNAAHASPLFLVSARRGEDWLCLQTEDAASASLPVMPPEFLEAHLMERLRGEPKMKQVLSLLAEILGICSIAPISPGR